MIAVLLSLAQVVASFAVEAEGPVRFGIPVDVRVLERGLRLDAGRAAQLQWSPLATEAPAIGEHVWIELVVSGLSGRARVLLGGAPPSAPAGGPVCRIVTEQQRETAAELRRTTWSYADGSVDTRERRVLLEADDGAGERRLAGEAIRRESEALAERRLRVRFEASFWRERGVLPRADGSGRELREALREAVPRLPRAPGARGRGDYLRGPQGETVTNQEFDTTLAFARLALADDDPALLARARECAWHLVDVDLDRRSGLPHRHGAEHREAAPELGHVWTSGALLVAMLCADRELLDELLGVVRALAARVRAREPRRGPADRLRDEAWPLFELESSLRLVDSAPVRAACDGLVASIVARYDPVLRSFRYGEGETRGGELVRDRIWVTAGILLPALRLHAARRPSRELEAILDEVGRAVLETQLDGRSGIALQVMRSARGPFDAVRVDGAAEAVLLLDGLEPRDRGRVLARTGLRRALDGVLSLEHDDLATRFSIVGRCEWVMR
ncbi:MAG: hypothetical protein IT457_14980 [Planctomycetes bacterium]|nr:hypothetical protein [Planctomycetota bacterium]